LVIGVSVNALARVLVRSTTREKAAGSGVGAVASVAVA